MRHLALLLIPLLLSCFSQRKGLEHAARYEREGLTQQAFERYDEVYTRRPASAEALVGMKRTAQARLDGLITDALLHYGAGDLSTGDRKRQEAAQYKQQMDRRGLDLHWDTRVDGSRAEAQRREAASLYTQADIAFRAGRYKEAEDLAGRSVKLDPALREAEYLVKLAQLEPLYLQGLRAFELGLWRDAYRHLRTVTDRDPGFKDAWAKAEEARQRAQLVMAYVPLFNRNVALGVLANDGQLETQLAAAVKQAMLDLKDPLLVLVDRDNTTQLLAEQQRQLSGIFDDRYVVDAGKMMGARYVVTCRVLRYDEVLKREIELQAQLLDAESGRIHLCEVVRVNRQEIGRGNTRAQLLDRAAKRIAQRIAAYDPYAR